MKKSGSLQIKGKEKGPARLAELIGPVLDKAGGKKPRRPESIAVVAAWPDIVGEKLARVSRAVSLNDGRLMVEVTAPAWKQELLFVKKRLIQEINSRMGASLVGDMVINVREFVHGES